MPVCVCALGHFSCVWIFATLWTIARQAPQSMGFSRQEYWSGLPFPSPGDLWDPGIEPTSLMSPALVGGFFASDAMVIFRRWCEVWRGGHIRLSGKVRSPWGENTWPEMMRRQPCQCLAQQHPGWGTSMCKGPEPGAEAGQKGGPELLQSDPWWEQEGVTWWQEAGTRSRGRRGLWKDCGCWECSGRSWEGLSRWGFQSQMIPRVAQGQRIEGREQKQGD